MQKSKTRKQSSLGKIAAHLVLAIALAACGDDGDGGGGGDPIIACGADGPIEDLRAPCEDYAYVYRSGGQLALLSTADIDGETNAIVVYGVVTVDDVLAAAGAVTSKTTAVLEIVTTGEAIDEGRSAPLDPGSDLSISDGGNRLSFRMLLGDADVDVSDLPFREVRRLERGSSLTLDLSAALEQALGEDAGADDELGGTLSVDASSEAAAFAEEVRDRLD
jgi:hypothetical protein